MRIYWEYGAWQAFALWARLANKKLNCEVSAIGAVEVGADGGVWITEVFLCKQENTAASTELDDVDQAILTGALATRKLNPVSPENLRAWIHSHPNTGGKPSPSGQDMKEFAHGLEVSPWSVSVITDATAEHFYGRIDIASPRVSEIVPVEIVYPSMPDERERELTKLFTEKVSKAPPALLRMPPPSRKGGPKSAPRRTLGDMVSESWWSDATGDSFAGDGGRPGAYEGPIVEDIIRGLRTGKLTRSEAVSELLDYGLDAGEAVDIVNSVIGG